jgi:hypothetical protein
MQAKKGYKVLTPDQALPLIELAKEGKNNVEHVETTEQFEIFETAREIHKANFIETKIIPELEAESETTAIVAEAVSKQVDVAPPDLDAVRDIHVDQEDIQAQEMKFIKSLQHKSSLEQHMLEKYQTEIPMGRLDTMKAIANQMLCDLAKENRLYLIDGKIVVS